MPGVIGSGGFSWYWPPRMSTSGKFSPHASTRTSTWPGPATGSSTSPSCSTSSGAPSSLARSALISAPSPDDLAGARRVAPLLAGRPCPWLAQVAQLVEVVAGRLDDRPLLHVRRDLDGLAGGATGVGELVAVVVAARAHALHRRVEVGVAPRPAPGVGPHWEPDVGLGD